MPPGRHSQPTTPVVVTVPGRTLRRAGVGIAVVAMMAFPTIAVMGSGDASGATTMVDQQLDGIVAAGNAAPTIDPAALPQPGAMAQAQGGAPTAAIQVLDAAGRTHPIAATAFATGSSRGIPERVLAAYQHAAAAMAAADPHCGLPWWVLAGIGRIESGHAAGGHVDSNGTTIGRILGPRLDGSTPGTATVPDSDRGTLDGDPLFDRAVGPMQLLPSTWAMVASDGNGDGRADPNNVFDASLGAARYLCAGGARLTTDAGLAAAVMRYNQSSSYVAEVLSWGHAYRDDVMPTPDATGPIPTAPDTTPASGVRRPSLLRQAGAPAPPRVTPSDRGTAAPPSPRTSAPPPSTTAEPTSTAQTSSPTTGSSATPTTSSTGCTPAPSSPAPTSPTSDPSAPATATPTTSTTGTGSAC